MVISGARVGVVALVVAGWVAGPASAGFGAFPTTALRVASPMVSPAAAGDVASVTEPAPSDSTLVPTTPVRLLDTREGPGATTIDHKFEGIGPIKGGDTLELQVSWRGGLGFRLDGVMLNITAVRPSAIGYVTVYPCDEPRPLASNLNYGPGDVVANTVLAKTSWASAGSALSGKTVCLYSQATTHLVVDVTGYVPDLVNDPTTITPARLLETRDLPGATTVDHRFEGTGTVRAGQTVQLTVAGRGGVPSDAIGAMLNVTAVRPADIGYVTVFPCGQRRPLASNLNYQPGDVVANTALAMIGTGGAICLYTYATTHLVVDVTGHIPASFASSTERDALVAFHLATGPWMEDDGWATDRDPCGWWGVTCDPSGVIALDLRDIGVKGAIPPEIGNLTHLTRLNLSGNRDIWEVGNHVTSLPAEIGNLTNLEYLNLSDNRLGSLPPEFGKLTNLQTLDLGSSGYYDYVHHFTGLPDEFGSLTNLRTLVIYSEELTSLPATFGNLTNLQGLSLYGSRLVGLPAGFGNLASLDSLTVSLQATSLPAEFGNLTNLRYLRLDAPLAALPAGFGNLTKLQALNLRVNVASLPATFGNLTNLQDLSIDSDSLSTLPASFGALINLRSLSLLTTALTSLPPEFGNLEGLQALGLHASLSTLPSTFGNLTNLQTLNLEDNQLTSLPASFGNLTNLQTLNLEDNQLTSLPASFGNLTSLRTLEANRNLLTNLPTSFGGLTHLRSLYLDDNPITALPTGFGNLAGLFELNIRRSRLTTLPAEFGNLTGIGYVNLYGGLLTGIPDEIGNLVNLRELFLNDNQISGDITAPMAALRAGETTLWYLKISGTGCPTISDPLVEQWIEGFDPDWDSGCP